MGKFEKNKHKPVEEALHNPHAEVNEQKITVSISHFEPFFPQVTAVKADDKDFMHLLRCIVFPDYAEKLDFVPSSFREKLPLIRTNVLAFLFQSCMDDIRADVNSFLESEGVKGAEATLQPHAGQGTPRGEIFTLFQTMVSYLHTHAEDADFFIANEVANNDKEEFVLNLSIYKEFVGSLEVLKRGMDCFIRIASVLNLIDEKEALPPMCASIEARLAVFARKVVELIDGESMNEDNYYRCINGVAALECGVKLYNQICIVRKRIGICTECEALAGLRQAIEDALAGVYGAADTQIREGKFTVEQYSKVFLEDLRKLVPAVGFFEHACVIPAAVKEKSDILGERKVSVHNALMQACTEAAALVSKGKFGEEECQKSAAGLEQLKSMLESLPQVEQVIAKIKALADLLEDSEPYLKGAPVHGRLSGLVPAASAQIDAFFEKLAPQEEPFKELLASLEEAIAQLKEAFDGAKAKDVEGIEQVFERIVTDRIPAPESGDEVYTRKQKIEIASSMKELTACAVLPLHLVQEELTKKGAALTVEWFVKGGHVSKDTKCILVVYDGYDVDLPQSVIEQATFENVYFSKQAFAFIKK